MENRSKENLVLAIQKVADAVEHGRVNIPFENKHDRYVQGELRSLATHASKADNEITDLLFDIFKAPYKEGIEVGKAIAYRNCLKSISILGAAVGCGLLAKDIFEAVKFAINEQNKTDDHCEDGDQKEQS